jgi:hypothetical protein
MFKIFNHTNLAPAGWPFAGEAGEIGSTVEAFLGNPGIGPGEPFNVQFSLKILAQVLRDCNVQGKFCKAIMDCWFPRMNSCHSC